MQFRERFLELTRVEQMFAQLEAQLQVGRISLRTLPRLLDQDFRAALLRLLQRRRPLRVRLVLRSVFREKSLMLRDLVFRALHAQIGNLAQQAGVRPAGQFGSVLKPGDRAFEIFLLLVQRSQSPRMIDAFRLGLMPFVGLGDLLLERFAG